MAGLIIFVAGLICGSGIGFLMFVLCAIRMTKRTAS